MRSARLRSLVTIQTPTQTTDAYGAPTETWATYATRWAEVEPLSGREYFAAQQVASEVSHKIKLRHDSLTGSITPKMRISWDSRVFDINSVINAGERDREVELMCVERI